MKRIFALVIAMTLLVFAVIPCFGEEAAEMAVQPSEEQKATDEAVSEKEDFGILMTELYEYWQSYTATEGDNVFEKAVNFAWKYRGDIGGVAAAAAVIVLLLVMAFRFMPTLKKYFDYIYKGNMSTKAEIMDEVKSELSAYAPALSTVEQVAELYPAFKALVNELVTENADLKKLITDVGDKLSATESRHASEMKLQGETFRDLITLAALPAGKKKEILDKYRVIMSEAGGENAAEGARI